jgi:hypothetical protein
MDDLRLGQNGDVEFKRFMTGWFYWAADKRQLAIEEFDSLHRSNIEDWYVQDHLYAGCAVSDSCEWLFN